MELATLDRPTDLSVASTESLRAELARELKHTADQLLRLAAIVAELEKRGEDLSDLKFGLLGHLRQIAMGRLAPEAVVRFVGSPSILNRVAALSLPEQRRLAAGERVRLLVLRDGSADHLMADPLKLTRDQIDQVFDRGTLRDDAGQRLVLESRAWRPAKPAEKKRRVRADKQAGGIRVGRQFASRADALTALAELAVPEDTGERTRQTSPVMLTEEEHARLRRAAADADVSVPELIRRAMRAAGLI